MIDNEELTRTTHFYQNSKGQKFCLNCINNSNKKVKLKPIYVAIRDEDSHEIIEEWTEYVCPDCRTRVKP